jgi:hypothetical protein
MNNGKWSGRLDSVEERLRELELIVTEKHRPPSRLGSAFRYLVENIETLRTRFFALSLSSWCRREPFSGARYKPVASGLHAGCENPVGVGDAASYQKAGISIFGEVRDGGPRQIPMLGSRVSRKQ